jgi:hypothetical protein
MAVTIEDNVTPPTTVRAKILGAKIFSAKIFRIRSLLRFARTGSGGWGLIQGADPSDKVKRKLSRTSLN